VEPVRCAAVCYAAIDGIAFVLPKKLVQIQLHFTLITTYNAPVNFIAAFRANIAVFFILNPFFSTHLSLIWNSPQNNLFANGHWEIVNELTRKFIALMTSSVAIFLGAFPDLTLSAMHKKLIRQAAAALNVFYGKLFTIGEFAFAMNVSLVKTD
jgi:hypothetical protein